jgi:hypothetical protein
VVHEVVALLWIVLAFILLQVAVQFGLFGYDRAHPRVQKWLDDRKAENLVRQVRAELEAKRRLEEAGLEPTPERVKELLAEQKRVARGGRISW